jgi:hypothetical protein
VTKSRDKLAKDYNQIQAVYQVQRGREGGREGGRKKRGGVGGGGMRDREFREETPSGERESEVEGGERERFGKSVSYLYAYSSATCISLVMYRCVPTTQI